MTRFTARAVVAMGLAALAAAASADEHVRGVVKAVKGDAVTVTAADGHAQELRLDEKTRVGAVTRADLSALTPDAFVGTTAVEAKDGTMRALEVHVFPEAMRGTGEGHRPWDLEPGATMTNATVSGVGAAGAGGGATTMTNANVSSVAGAGGGKTLKLTYAGGQKTVVVAPGTPVVRLEAADRAALAPGQHVFAVGTRQPDGTVLVARVFYGKDGAVPPM